LSKFVDAIEQNVLSRQVRGLSGGGGTESNRRRVDGWSIWRRLAASLTGGGGRWRRFQGIDGGYLNPT